MAILSLADEKLCLNWLLTSTCNAGCSFCIANGYMAKKETSQIMSDKNFWTLISILKQDPVEQVNLLGGEPSLHPKALEFARDINNLGVPVGFSTNGIWGDSFREIFEKNDTPLEIEITYLGTNNYNRTSLEKINKTFEQLGHSNHDVSLGIIIDSPYQDYSEHLRIAKNKGFKLRWALLEPTRMTGLTKGYDSIAYLKQQGELAIKMIKEANAEGITTWADLTVPRCAIKDQDLYLFKEQNDIQFKCPPFFDISPDLDVWRCLPIAPEYTPKVNFFGSFREAYRELNKAKEPYKKTGVFDECKSCAYLDDICSGGPVIAKKLKNENRF